MTLEELIHDLSDTPLRTQQKFNAAYLAELACFRQRLEEVPEECRELLRPLLPSLQLVRRVDIVFDSSLSVTRTRGFRIQALPLNLGYCVSHQVERSRQGRMHLSVEQTPLAGAAKEILNARQSID